MEIVEIHDRKTGVPLYLPEEVLAIHLNDHYTDKLNTKDKVFGFIGKRVTCQDVTDGHEYTGFVKSVLWNREEFAFELTDCTEEYKICYSPVLVDILDIFTIRCEEEV